MLANKLQSYSVESTNEMRKSVRAARARYAVYLEEEKKKNESLKTKSAKKVIYRNIKEVHSKVTEKSETSKILDEKFVLLVEEAEKKKDINLVVQANALKRKNKETEEERRKLEETEALWSKEQYDQTEEKTLKNWINQLVCVGNVIVFQFVFFHLSYL